MAEPQIDNLYGDSVLYKKTPFAFSETFNPAGSSEMPLGHNADERGYGLSFDVNRDKRHALTIGRSRGGKGVSSIIPALLTYKGSMVVIDPKGENAWITAQRRRDMGQRVVILDAWDEVNRRYGAKVGATEEITRFNPLSALDPEHPDFADDVSAIAEAFILQTGNDPHWPDSARELVGGFIASEVQRNPGKASIKAVRKLLSGKLAEIMTNVDRTIHDFPDSVAANKLAAAFEVDEEGKPLSVKEMASIRSTARTQTAFLDSQRLVDSMETDEPPFNLEDLATQPTTLYLVLPVDKLKTHGRWLRMILTLAIRAISRLDTPPDPPVLFMLDELGTISPGSGLSMVEQSYGLMAGLGIRIWAFLQDLPQLQRDYPQSWETFISNSSVIQLLDVGDNTTSSYFSQYLGNKTINAKTGGYSMKSKQYGPNESYEQRLRYFMLQCARRYHPELPEDRSISILNAVRNGKWEDGTKFTTGQEGDKHEFLYREFLHYVDLAKQGLADQGFSPSGYSEWTPDEQLASRPVMFPWEIEKADASKCILIRPGQENCQLKRFVYYSDPALKPLARLDPKFPDTPATADVEPIVLLPAAPPVSPAPTYQPTPAPYPVNDTRRPPTSVGDELADLGKDLGKKAAGAAVNFLKDRLKR